jgi:hypothetical protein
MRMTLTPFKWLSVLALSLSTCTLIAQVTFTAQPNLIQSIGGTSVANCAADMNGDGLDDIVRVMNNGIYIDYQQTNGAFSPAFYPMNIQTSPNWSIVAADIDGNGFTDLCLGGGSRVSFVYANDTGTGFTEVQHPEYIFCQRSTFADIDNDGNLDAFVCHDVALSHPYRNVNGVLQLDQTLINTVPLAGNYSAIWVDYDNDRDIDLYMTKCRGGSSYTSPERPSKLYRNNGDGTYTEVGVEANMNDVNQSWSTAFEDFDNDGDFDAFIANHNSDVPGGPANKFMRNNGDGTFTDIIGTTGISPSSLGSWNCDAADFDNNGFADILSEMSKEIYWNNGGAVFTGADLPFSSGGIGDFNNDGFLDVISGNNVWMNNGNSHNYIKFNLEGIVSNRSAVGARVEIHGVWGVQIREVRAGRSFDPASSLTIHFGLGSATAVEQVVIYWPSGVVTTIENPPINQQHHVIEANCLNPPVEITAAGPTAICPNAQVTLTAPESDSYMWSNGATTQSITVNTPASYSVVVWNNDECASMSNNIVVTHILEQAPQISLEGEPIMCHGGTVTLSSTVASTYQWNNGATAQSVEITESGSYFVSVTGQCSGEEYESLPIEITMLDNPNPVAADVVLTEPGTATLTATGNNLEWFASATSTEVLATGETFVTEPLDINDQVSYWVQATTVHEGEEQTGGIELNTTLGGLPSTGGRMMFNVTEPFILEQVKVYVPSNSTAGNRTIQLFNASGTLINSKVIYCPIGITVVDVNMEIPAGEDLQIGCAENNLFRNSNVSGFPILIGDVGYIHNTTFGTNYYYYFYEWKIRKHDVVCTSDRVEVNASVIEIISVSEKNELGVQVYPNPATELISLTASQDLAGAKLIITDMNGRTVLSTKLLQSGKNQLNIQQLAAGVYHMVILHQDKKSVIEFLKQ